MLVDCFLLADSAEEVNGKLYVLGGGWDHIYVPNPPTVHHQLALAIRMCVPWDETNYEMAIEIRLEHEDGEDILSEPLRSEMNVGRPPTIRPGNDIIVLFAITLRNIDLPKLGTYRFIMTVDGDQKADAKFHVHDKRQAVFPTR